jgi:diguanylate cyclase (GGDEF)-like protein/putative nucleotidyltransferase with HDIG domain
LENNPVDIQGESRPVDTRFDAASRPARILMADSDPVVRALRRRLEGQGADVRVVALPGEIGRAAQLDPPDLVVIHLATCAPDAIYVVRALRGAPQLREVPIFVLTDVEGPAGRTAYLTAGATDCVARPVDMDEAAARVHAVLLTKTRQDALRRRLRFFEDLASSDALTSLLNRRALDDRLHLEMERAVRDGHPLSCLVLDLDWFKGINDRYGHQVGDDALRHIAQMLVNAQASDDAVCRYGGEEFVWLMPGVDRAALIVRAERFRQRVASTEMRSTEDAFHVTVSIGGSTYQWSEHGRISAPYLIEGADAALRDAKKHGRNRVMVCEPQAPESPAETPPVDETRDRLSEDWRHTTRFNAAMREVMAGAVAILTEAIEAKDAATIAHCRRVSSTATAVAEQLGLAAPEVERIRLASLLHDIGKLAIPDSVLQKPGPLGIEEWGAIRRHPARGAEMLRRAAPFSEFADLVLHHQEAFDGSGYPAGLAGNAIPLGARIIRVADAFDAMTSHRAYRPRRTVDDAKIQLKLMAGTMLDPKVVDALLLLLSTMSPVDLHVTMWGAAGLPG